MPDLHCPLCRKPTPHEHDRCTVCKPSKTRDSLLKPRPSLLVPEFVLDVAKVMSYGALKYEPNGWKKCGDINQYHDALLRHTLLIRSEPCDVESGLPHTAHAACNAMFIHHLSKR